MGFRCDSTFIIGRQHFAVNFQVPARDDLRVISLAHLQACGRCNRIAIVDPPGNCLRQSFPIIFSKKLRAIHTVRNF